MLRMVASTALLTMVTFAVAFGAFGFGPWGTIDQAARVYFEHETDFQDMMATIEANHALAYVDSATPIDTLHQGASVRGPVTSNVRVAYNRLGQQIDKLKINNINVLRNETRTDRPLILVDFNVFGRGVGGSTEGIDIEWIENGYQLRTFQTLREPCRQLVEPHWYVCRYG